MKSVDSTDTSDPLSVLFVTHSFCSLPVSCLQNSTDLESVIINKGFPGGSVVKNLPAMQEMLVGSLGPKDPLEEGMATHSSIIAWRIPWTEEPSELQSMRSQIVGRD